MKYQILCLFTFLAVCLSAQIEVTNLDTIYISMIDETEHYTLEVTNNFPDTIDLDWEVEFIDNAETLLEISVSDISLDYTPDIHTTCGLIFISNLLASNESYPMGIHTTLSEIPQSIDNSTTLAYFNLYRRGECESEQLLHLPIHLNIPISNLAEEERNEPIKLTPNPAQSYIQIDTNNDLPLSFTIYDLQARKVLDGEASNNKIDVSELLPGEYLFTANNQTLRFVKL